MTTFLVIGLIGLGLVAVSLVLGDLFDGVFDALAGDVFSSAVIGGFVSAFGFGAALMQGIGTPGRRLGPGRDRRRAGRRLAGLVADQARQGRRQRRHPHPRGRPRPLRPGRSARSRPTASAPSA